jgi:hypothetical protein
MAIQSWKRGLEHFPEKLIDFSVKKMRQNNKLEKNCDSTTSHFALGTSPAASAV